MHFKFNFSYKKKNPIEFGNERSIEGKNLEINLFFFFTRIHCRLYFLPIIVFSSFVLFKGHLQVTNHLENFISTLSIPTIVTNDEYSLAKAENDVHLTYAERQLPKKWLMREKIDRMLDIWMNKSKGYFHIIGNELSGKTALLCLLYEELIKKDRYVIIR